MLVFEDSKVRDAFDHRSRVRSTSRHHKFEIFGDLGAMTIFGNYPGSSLRNQSMVFSTSPVMRPS